MSTPCDLRGDDEGRGLVVGVGGGGADAGDEDLVGEQQVAAPVGSAARRLDGAASCGASARRTNGTSAGVAASPACGAAAPPDRRAPACPRGWRSGRRRRSCPAEIWHSTGQALHSILSAAMRSLRGGARSSTCGKRRHVHAGQAVGLGVFGHRGDLVHLGAPDPAELHALHLSPLTFM